MRKYFLGLVLVISCLLLSHGVQAAYIPMSGDIVKLANNPAVYFIDDYNTRHLFVNSVTFWSWYTGSWSDQKIKIISQTDFDNFEVGKNITVRPGTGLIQFDNGTKVYALSPGAVLCEIRALYGDDWQSRIITMQNSFENDYFKNSACSIISTSKYPDGSIIQYVGSKDVWYIEGGKKRQFSGSAFTVNNFKDSYIIKNVPASISYTAGSKISTVETGLSVSSVVNASNPNLTPSKIDFAVTDVITPIGDIYNGSIIDIQVVIKNLGINVTTGKGIRGTVLTATDWTTDLISHVDFPSVAKPLLTGQSFTITYRGKFLSVGDKTITAKVDEGGEIAEANENNNTFSKKVPVIK